jgi:hypothetical protein
MPLAVAVLAVLAMAPAASAAEVTASSTRPPARAPGGRPEARLMSVLSLRGKRLAFVAAGALLIGDIDGSLVRVTSWPSVPGPVISAR